MYLAIISYLIVHYTTIKDWAIIRYYFLTGYGPIIWQVGPLLLLADKYFFTMATPIPTDAVAPSVTLIHTNITYTSLKLDKIQSNYHPGFVLLTFSLPWPHFRDILIGPFLNQVTMNLTLIPTGKPMTPFLLHSSFPRSSLLNRNILTPSRVLQHVGKFSNYITKVRALFIRFNYSKKPSQFDPHIQLLYLPQQRRFVLWLTMLMKWGIFLRICWNASLYWVPLALSLEMYSLLSHGIFPPLPLLLLSHQSSFEAILTMSKISCQ
jgi:hypothetical protein